VEGRVVARTSAWPSLSAWTNERACSDPREDTPSAAGSGCLRGRPHRRRHDAVRERLQALGAGGSPRTASFPSTIRAGGPGEPQDWERRSATVEPRATSTSSHRATACPTSRLPSTGKLSRNERGAPPSDLSENG